MITFKKTTSLAAAAFLLATSTFLLSTQNTALAAPAVPPTSQDFELRFEYTETEVSDAAAANKLLKRLESRVESKCGPNGRASIQAKRAAKTCVDETMARAVSRIDSPILTEAFQNRSDG